MRILGIDPGPTTGLCIYDTSQVPGTSRKPEVWHEWLSEFPGTEHQTVWNVLQTVSFDLIICEKFEFRKDDQARDKIDYLACELVGTVKTYCQTEGVVGVMQGSSLVGKTAFWSDDNEKVKRLGFYNPKCAPHGMDALRHVLYYLTFTLNQTEWFERLR